MEVRLLLLALICLHAPRWALAQQPEEATVIVKGSTRIAETDENYVCATIDWWPPEKCNYNQCPWGQSSILNLDLDHPFLAQAIQAFDNLRIRLGGSLQDRVVYDVGTDSPCSPFRNMSNDLFGFSVGCLGMDRWDKLNDLFQKTGAIVTFGVNALYGRYNVRRSIWAGKWNSTNAYDFLKYTISKGYPVDSWEFGNELSGHGIGARVDAKLYGKDVVEFKSILRQLYKAPLSQPLLLAPGGFFDQQWYSQLLQTSGHGVVSALTHHVYNLGGGNDVHLIRKILDPKYLDRAEDTYRDMQLTIQRHGTWASAWVSESGGVFNNGGLLVSNTFINSIWYLDQLGMASKYNTKVFCRQTLIGGNYGLLDTQTFLPNPDYYSALLWHRLMGNGVLSVDINAPRRLRAYAHCRKQQQGVILLLINLSNSTGYNVTLQNDINVSLDKRPDLEKRASFAHRLKRAVSWLGRKPSSDIVKREEYHLTAKDGDLQSKTMLLNGVPLELGDDGSVPALDPALVAVDSPVHLAPTSIAFVVLPKFEAKACS
ncbi:heparanase-like protein 1 [Phragmites australis]|uniref:heparanase-like protein 1 n=1 Tax=Phragmites australis TaxID=29695 RepID=UPI002D77BB45|nr:heparanase-like protein 1 [Phragmites australis]